MIVGIQGTKNFSDYTIFLRAMGTALSTLKEDDKEITVLSVGTRQINSFAQEFVNVSERSLKARGIKIRFRKVPVNVLKETITTLDYFIFLSKPKESLSELVDLAEAKDVEVGVYRY
jgi:hypothetical protein